MTGSICSSQQQYRKLGDIPMDPQRVGSRTPRRIRDFEKGEEKGGMSKAGAFERLWEGGTLYDLEPLF